MAAQPSRNIPPARVLDFGYQLNGKWSFSTVVAPPAAIRADGRVFLDHSGVLDISRLILDLTTNSDGYVQRSPFAPTVSGPILIEYKNPDKKVPKNAPTKLQEAKALVETNDGYNAITDDGKTVKLNKSDVDALVQRRLAPIATYDSSIGRKIDPSLHTYSVSADSGNFSTVLNTDTYSVARSVGEKGTGPRSVPTLQFGPELSGFAFS